MNSVSGAEASGQGHVSDKVAVARAKEEIAFLAGVARGRLPLCTREQDTARQRCRRKGEATWSRSRWILTKDGAARLEAGR